MGAAGRGGRESRPRADAAAIPLPAGRSRPRPRASQEGRTGRIARAAPRGRILLAFAALIGLAIGGYVLARNSSLFALDRFQVNGAPPAVAQKVRDALQPFAGTSLVALDGAAVDRAVGSLPDVVAVSHDRAFPHTLKLFVVPEVPAVVLRRGQEAWVISARGRVLRRVPLASAPPLPRVWVGRRVDLTPGITLTDEDGGLAARSLAASGRARLGIRVQTVRFGGGEVVWQLSSKREIRLGDGSSLPLKLAVAGRILSSVAPGEYLDVSVPERPVAGPIAAPKPPPTLLQPSTSTGG